ncbi:MAG: MATE family efflux transporter [Selenomonadaceae bacterium]|nr:MATE family efflux transporter [Selenomonadaceae bacterium]
MTWFSEKCYVWEKFKGIFLAATMAMLCEYLVLLSDEVIIGNMWGELAISGVALATPFFSVIVFVSYMIAGGTGVLMSAADGRGDRALSDRYISQALQLTAAAAITLLLLYLTAGDWIIRLLGTDEAVISYALEYFSCLAWLPAVQILMAVLYTIVLYRGGETPCNISTGVMVVLNISLSVYLGLTMGLAGVSLATVIANIVGLIPLLWFLTTRQGHIRFTPGLRQKDVAEILRLSFAESVVFLLIAGQQFILNWYLMARYSVDAVVTCTVVLYLVVLLMTLFEGLCEILIPVVSVYWAEKNYIGNLKVLRLLERVGLAESLLITLVLLAGADILPLLFGVRTPELLADTALAIRLFVPAVWFFCIVKLYAVYYICIERIGLSVWFSLWQLLVVPVLFTVIGCELSGLNGGWVGMTLAQIVTWAMLKWYCHQHYPGTAGLSHLPLAALERQFLRNIPARLSDWQTLRREIVGLPMTACLSPAAKQGLAEALRSGDELIARGFRPDTMVEVSLLCAEDSITLILRCHGTNPAGNPRTVHQYTYSPAAGDDRYIANISTASF